MRSFKVHAIFAYKKTGLWLQFLDFNIRKRDLYGRAGNKPVLSATGEWHPLFWSESIISVVSKHGPPCDCLSYEVLSNSCIPHNTVWICVTKGTTNIWESSPIKIWNQDYLKIRFQMVKFSKGGAVTKAILMVPIIGKPDLSNSSCFLSLFQIFLTKWRPKGWASGFQISFKIHTICKSTSF